MNKMQFVLREIPEKFSAKGGYTGRFVNQKGLDGRAERYGQRSRGDA
jgi:hypothetical protein